MSSFQWECLRSARQDTGAANARIFHKSLHFAFTIASGLVLVATLRTAEPPASWRQHLLEADVALASGDRNRARHLYSQAARLAAWQSNWYGALAAACGMMKLEKPRGDYFATRSMLIRAMIVAKKHRSAAALHSVAEAFASIGEHNAAAMVKASFETERPKPFGGLCNRQPASEFVAIS